MSQEEIKIKKQTIWIYFPSEQVPLNTIIFPEKWKVSRDYKTFFNPRYTLPFRNPQVNGLRHEIQERTLPILELNYLIRNSLINVNFRNLCLKNKPSMKLGSWYEKSIYAHTQFFPFKFIIQLEKPTHFLCPHAHPRSPSLCLKHLQASE